MKDDLCRNTRKVISGIIDKIKEINDDTENNRKIIFEKIKNLELQNNNDFMNIKNIVNFAENGKRRIKILFVFLFFFLIYVMNVLSILNDLIVDVKKLEIKQKLIYDKLNISKIHQLKYNKKKKQIEH
jgi:hypothetical protein